MKKSAASQSIYNRVRRARTSLARAARTVHVAGPGYTADAILLKKALDALRVLPLTKGMIDRIVEAWGIPPTAWSRARGVAPRSLGTYVAMRHGKEPRTQIPKELLPDKSK